MNAHVQFARWKAACLDAATTLLDSGLLTRAGWEFVLAMYHELDQWRSEEVPGQAASLARHQAEEHRLRWRERW